MNDKVLYTETTNLVSVGYQNPNWPILLADTFGRYHNRYWNHISKGESSYQ